MTIRQAILSGLSNGQATLPRLVPKAHPVSRYVEARRMEQAGLIARVGTVRVKNQHGGKPRIVWTLTPPSPIPRS